MAFRKEKMLEDIRTATSTALEPGEQARVHAYGLSGPSPWLSGGLIGIITQFMTKYYAIALTDRRLIFIRANRYSQKPKGVEISDAVSAIKLQQFRPGTFWNKLKFNDSSGRQMRVYLDRRWKQEATDIANALSPAGAAGSAA
jgi:hypothetical protein